jgi:hypothetical protein
MPIDAHAVGTVRSIDMLWCLIGFSLMRLFRIRFRRASARRNSDASLAAPVPIRGCGQSAIRAVL